MKLLSKIIVSRGFQRIMNKNQVSRFCGWMAGSNVPGFILRPMIRKYIRSFNISMDDYDFDIKTVKTFNAFFARKLKPGRREIKVGIVSPVDGYISESGGVANNRLFQVKGKVFTYQELLEKQSPKYVPKSYVTIYLSPADYHRIHAPFDMEIESLKYIPGTLHSVSFETLEREEKVFCRNERIVLTGKSDVGNFQFIMVGAIVVGCIRLDFHPMCSNKKGKGEEVFPEIPYRFKKGDELGYFELGSTVILLLDNQKLDTIHFKIHDKIMLGETICSG